MPKTKYIWDDENILMEKDEFGVTTKSYTLEPQLYGNLVSEFDGADTRYHHYDALGSTRQLTDQNGDLADDYIYDAWGNLVAHTGTSQTAFLWVGEIGYYWDEETGQYTVRARPYSPVISLWLSVDMLAFEDNDDWDLYRYAACSPLSQVDPTGMQTSPADIFRPDAIDRILLGGGAAAAANAQRLLVILRAVGATNPLALVAATIGALYIACVVRGLNKCAPGYAQCLGWARIDATIKSGGMCPRGWAGHFKEAREISRIQCINRLYGRFKRTCQWAMASCVFLRCGFFGGFKQPNRNERAKNVPKGLCDVFCYQDIALCPPQKDDEVFV